MLSFQSWLFLAGLWCFSAIAPPSQVSIATGSNADADVSFSWLTDDVRDDDISCKEVAIVEVFSSMATIAAVECLRYTFGSTFGNYTSGRIHRVHVKNLESADTEYRYRLKGDPEHVQRTFRTLPAQKRAYPLTFGVVGDLGQTSDALETVRHLDADSVLRLILHPGDMPYADTNSVRWDSYGLQVEPVASRLQWMVCPGNHEIETDTFTGENFVPYEARFAMPRVKPPVSKPSVEQVGCTHPWPSHPHPGPDCTPSIFTGSYDWGNSFYAFTAGRARVISLNSYTDTQPGSAQHTWLTAELTALRQKRAETPWLIVQMHCPFYNSNVDHYEERQAVQMRDSHGFEDLFFEHKVAIVLSGHVHAYERSLPVYRRARNPKGPTYIVIGDGGNREGHSSDYHPKPPWSAFRNGSSFGHGHLHLVNDTHSLWEWMVNNVSKPHVLSSRMAAKVADRHVRAGVSSPGGATSRWRSPLPARTVRDKAFVINPWVAEADSWLSIVV